MRKRLALVALGALVFLVACSIVLGYVAAPAARDLIAARSLVGGSVTRLSGEEVGRAQSHLVRAQRRLETPVARALGALPVVGSNLRAVRDVVSGLVPVLGAALRLDDTADSLRRDPVLKDGRVDMAVLSDASEALDGQLRAMRGLTERIESSLTGSLAPPLWDHLQELLARSRDLEARAEAFHGLLHIVDELLGKHEPRSYLLLLVNNAELRAAGGLVTGVGTVTARDGRLRLGRLYEVTELQDRPYRSVPAPSAFERRFGKFKANTTLWVNATMSPDVPDAALVAARLFESVTGTRTAGAFVLDPRGLASLIPRRESIPVPGTTREVTSSNLANFVYSESYELFDVQSERRQAVLKLGERAFESFLEGGLQDRESIERAALAFSSGHARFVSFDAAEQMALNDLSASGDLAPVEGDSLLVTTQNLGNGRGGGNKLDYWTDRSISHACRVEEDAASACSTSVTIANSSPDGLSSYVAGTPYGFLASYLEIYVPASAAVDRVELDGTPVPFTDERQSGRRSVGLYVEIPRSDRTRMTVDYYLPASRRYSLLATPQPLARDALIEIEVSIPEDWSVQGVDVQERSVVRYSGPFKTPVRIEAAPTPRRGFSAAWDAVVEFWKEPVF